MTIQPTLSEFETEIESLNRAYGDVKDILDLENPRMRDRIKDMLTLLWKALSPEYKFLASYDIAFLNDKEKIATYSSAIEQVCQIIIERNSESLNIWSPYILIPLRDYVSEVAYQAHRKAGKLEGEGHASDASRARHEYRAAEILLREIDLAETTRSLHMEVERAKLAATEAESAAENAKTAAGIASGSKLSARFAALSIHQLRTAAKFRWLTTLAVLAGIFGTYLLAFPIGPTHTTEVTPGNAIIRVSLLGAALGLAAYFARQAGYHRDLGTWAKTIEEQLLTFDGYMEPMHDEKLRDALRASFAARVFGPTPESKEDAGVSLSSSFINALMEMVVKTGAHPPR